MADNNTMYAISDSGVTVLPVGSLSTPPRVSLLSVEDLLFLGNFCNRNSMTQTFTISDPGEQIIRPFTITAPVCARHHGFSFERHCTRRYHRNGGSQRLFPAASKGNPVAASL